MLGTHLNDSYNGTLKISVLYCQLYISHKYPILLSISPLQNPGRTCNILCLGNVIGNRRICLHFHKLVRSLQIQHRGEFGNINQVITHHKTIREQWLLPSTLFTLSSSCQDKSFISSNFYTLSQSCRQRRGTICGNICYLIKVF